VTNAHVLCEESNLDFESIFRYQYLVAPGREPLTGMHMLPFGEHTFYVGKQLPHSILTDCKGRFFGYVIGIAVDKSGLITGEHQVKSLDLDDTELFSRFAEYLTDVSGRYAVLCGRGTEQRVYTDPVAMIGCVYDRDSGRVGSSVNLVLDREIDYHPKIDHEAVRSRGGKYTLFNTIDAHVKRLNGSFFLDLSTMIDTRFWPRVDHFERPVSDYPEIYDEIISVSRHNIGSIASVHKTAMPISGGRDSRLLAALAGDHIHEVDQPFTHIVNYSTRYDASIATLIANHLGIKHEIHSWRQPPPPQRSKFQYRQDLRGFRTAVGAQVSMPGEMEKNVHQFIDENQVVLRGHLTDLLRAVYVFTGKRSKWNEFFWQIRRLFPVPSKEFDE